MIKPTIGRVVWYRPNSADPDAQPNAALVCFVHSDTCVNLAVFDANGIPSSQTSVHLRQSDDEMPPKPYCEWMPYQKGQAAKTEAIEAQQKG